MKLYIKQKVFSIGAKFSVNPVSKTTREMILSETDTARLLIWLKKAAKATSEADFLKSI